MSAISSRAGVVPRQVSFNPTGRSVAVPAGYNPSAPRRFVRPDEPDKFDAMARNVAGMSDAYNSLADSGRIPNELRGYIDRDKNQRELDAIAQVLPGQMGRYGMMFQSQTPNGLGSILGYKTVYDANGNPRQVPIRGAAGSSLNTPMSGAVDGSGLRQFDNSQIWGNRAPAAPASNIQTGDAAIDKFANTPYPGNVPATMNSDRIRQFQDGSYGKENYGSGRVFSTSLGAGGDKGVQPTSERTNFELGAKDAFAEGDDRFVRRYPNLPPGKTPNDVDVALEAEQRIGRPGWATKYMQDLHEMRQGEEQYKTELLQKHIGDAKAALSGKTPEQVNEIMKYIVLGASTKMTKNGVMGINVTPAIQNLRSVIAKLPPDQRKMAIEYLWQMTAQEA